MTKRITRLKNALVFLILLLALLGAAWLALPAGWKYRCVHRQRDLMVALQTEIRPGDSLDAVQRRLGAGKPMPATWNAQQAQWAQRLPQEFPDGVANSDVFLNFTFGDGRSGIDLQFRSGVLVNHRPARFAGMETAKFTPAI